MVIMRHGVGRSIHTWLYQPYLRWTWSKNQRLVLVRRVGDAEAATRDPQHCWRCVCLPARQCASTSCLWHSRAFAPWDTPVHQSWHVASQQPWPQPVRLPHLGHAATARLSNTNPRYWRIAETSCRDMGWISAERGGQCHWSVAKKTGSMYPCRRWSLWTLAMTLLTWHSSCHASKPVLFRATNANPQLALFRATNVWRNATYFQSDEKVLHFTR